jgi:hypothetical protein
MDRRGFLKWLGGGAAVLTTTQAEKVQKLLVGLGPEKKEVPGGPVEKVAVGNDAGDAMSKKYVDTISRQDRALLTPAFYWKEPVDTVTDLPADGKDGDCRLVLDGNYISWIFCDGVGWVSCMGVL